MKQEQSKKESTNARYATPLALLGLVGELGFIISLPLLVMVVIGVKLDRWLEKSPLFLIIGIFIAALFSIILVAQKVKKAAQEAGL